MSDDARVIAVIDAYRCVINWGGSEVGMGDRFIIYGLGEALSDPETGEPLGTLEIVRGKAKAIHIQEKMTTLETYEREDLPGRRIIRRTPYNIVMGEQVEEFSPTEQAVLKDVAVGDYARPI